MGHQNHFRKLRDVFYWEEEGLIQQAHRQQISNHGAEQQVQILVT
jgi:uncharacterized membrane protein